MSTTLSSAAAAALVGNSRDLVGEILNRLPLSSVMRFRSVCKEWCSLTSTQSFIDMYQNINQPGPPHCKAGNNNSCFVVQYFDNGTESKSDHFNTLFFNLELDDDEDDEDDNMKMMKRIRERIHLSTIDNMKMMTWTREYIPLSPSIFSSQVGGGGEDGNGQMYKTMTTSRNSFFHKKIKAYHIKLISSSRGFLLFTAKPPAASAAAKTCCYMAAASSNSMEEELEYPALILYNPVTKEQLTVIAPPLKYVYCGFYYHSPTKEHRILYRQMGAGAAADGIIATFLVIELKNDYNFIVRQINLKCPKINIFPTYYYYLPDTSTPAVISNGSLHWIVSEDDHHGNIYSYPPIPECSHTILSFEMESEEFCWKKHPELSHYCHPLEWGSNDHRHKMNLLEMEGGGGVGLGLCDGFDSHKMNLLEIYVMVDYEKWTWVRRYRIDLNGYIDDHWEYGLHYKALQILQGDQLLLQVRRLRSSTPNAEEYAFYSLKNDDDDDDDEKQLADKKKKNKNKKNKRQVLVNIDRCKLGGRLRRMIIKPDKKNKVVVGNMVVLTPSLTSIFQRNRSTTTTTTEIPIKLVFIDDHC